MNLYSEEELIELINNSECFQIENKDENSELIIDLKMELQGYIYNYCITYFHYKDIRSEEHALEIVHAFNNTIDKYDKSKGPYLNLFIRAFVNELKRYFNEAQPNRGDIRIPSNVQKLINRIVRLSQKEHLDLNSDDDLEIISSKLCIPVLKIKETLEANNAITQKEYDNEIVNIFDRNTYANYNDDEYILRDNFMDRLNDINEFYIHLRKDLRKNISLYLSLKVIKVYVEYFGNDGINELNKFNYMNQEILKNYNKYLDINMKSACEMFGIYEETIARSINNFKKKYINKKKL